jgi:hypothetical protein
MMDMMIAVDRNLNLLMKTWPESQEFGERHYEGWNWRQICSDLDDFISEPCGDLVTSDGNALTAEGKATLERIACIGETAAGVLVTQNLLAALQGLRC